jgi:hypothetical protein
MSESKMQALVVVLSAMFEALPAKAQHRASILIEDSSDLIDDLDAKELMATFHRGA